jgi:hypothetical protein
LGWVGSRVSEVVLKKRKVSERHTQQQKIETQFEVCHKIPQISIPNPCLNPLYFNTSCAVLFYFFQQGKQKFDFVFLFLFCFQQAKKRKTTLKEKFKRAEEFVGKFRKQSKNEKHMRYLSRAPYKLPAQDQFGSVTLVILTKRFGPLPSRALV